MENSTITLINCLSPFLIGIQANGIRVQTEGDVTTVRTVSELGCLRQLIITPSYDHYGNVAQDAYNTYLTMGTILQDNVFTVDNTFCHEGKSLNFIKFIINLFFGGS